MVDDSCSVLVNSCDKYEDAWYPFFELVKKYWFDCPYKFYLNTEKKHYEHDGIALTVLNNCKYIQGNLAWGARIRACLKQIDTPYVILLLDDFFLQEKVNQAELESCLALLKEDRSIIAIYFKRIKGFVNNFQYSSKYYLMSENKKYKLNLQAGLWRTSELIKLIFNDDSPWSFEEEGYFRVLDQSNKFLCSKDGTHSNKKGCVFPYLTDRKLGFGIWDGKWLWNNNKLFKKNNICINNVRMEKFKVSNMICYYCKRIKDKLTDIFIEIL